MLLTPEDAETIEPDARARTPVGAFQRWDEDMGMTVGIVRISFRLHGNQSLKEKRRVVKSLIEKSRHRFNVSVAEVADQDLHQRATIGVAVIGSDSRVLNSILDRIVEFMDSMNLAELVRREVELIPLGD